MAGFGSTGDIITADIRAFAFGAIIVTPPAEEQEDEELAPSLIPLQRWRIRTATLDQAGNCSVEDLRISIKRGVTLDIEPKIRMRTRRDKKPWSKWITRSLGKSGERVSTIHFGPLGTGVSWEFEWECTDDCDVEMIGAEAIIKRIGH